MVMMKIGYFADGPWSHRALDRLLADQGIRVQFICARYDAPDPVLKSIAEEKGVPFIVTPNINSNEFVEQVDLFECDLLVSMSFNQIFGHSLINLTLGNIINCHAGKLPFYRGRNVLNWALINDEKEFGITVHYVDEGVDTGDIILQRVYPISDHDDYQSLLDLAYDGCAEVLYDAISDISKGNLTRVKQSTIHPVGTYCSRRREGDEALNWDLTSREIFNFVRAICLPGPQARTFCNGNQVFINKVELVADAPKYLDIPGSILKKEKSSMLVKTKDSFVRITEWSSDFTLKVGDRLK